MSQIINIVGKRFGRLTVVSFHGFREFKNSTRRSEWVCKCDCGVIKIKTGKELKEGRTNSCGCLQKELQSKRSKTHGMSKTRIYQIWTSMKARCQSKSDSNWDRYGGRGIYVSKEWSDSFEKFLSDMGVPCDGMSLDRIDNDGPYSKDNCRWATRLEQSENTRRSINVSFNGETKSLRSLCINFGVPYTTALQRLRKFNLPIEEVLSKTSLRSKLVKACPQSHQ